ncbi:MAG: F0F1 ATP synthase subunit A, partial [Tepidiformaceae bacterium]
MKPVYIVGAIVVVLVWLAIGLLVAQGPQPEIVVPAETIFTIGPLHVTNTLITAWIVMAFLIGISLLATRSSKLIPSGLQNFVEAVIAFLYGQVEDIAGAKNAPKFFMAIATFFLFIIASNWFGLFPVFNAIGKTEDVGHEVFHELSSAEPHKLTLKDGVYEEDHKFAGTKMEESGGITLIKPGAKAIDFKVKAG